MQRRAAWTGIGILTLASIAGVGSLHESAGPGPGRLAAPAAPAPPPQPGVTPSGPAPPLLPGPDDAAGPGPGASLDTAGLRVMGHDRLEGVVIDPSGTPIAGARVYLRLEPGQPAVLDAPWAWSTHTDQDGRWLIEHAWAERSVLYAWAPGHERACVNQPTPTAPCRLVLEPAHAILVTVRAPERLDRFQPLLREARLRIRLGGEGAIEHPHLTEDLAAEWAQVVEPDVPTLVRIPRAARAYLTTDAPELACEPAFVALPVVAREVVFDLVRSATLYVRLLDSATRRPLPLGPDTGFASVGTPGSRFALEATQVDDEAIWFRRGVAPGTYAITAQWRGYVAPNAPHLVEVPAHDSVVAVDVPLDRDMEHAVVHVRLHHAEGSPTAHAPIEHPTVLLRRREDAPPVWGHFSEAHAMVSGARKTFARLRPGTYDILAWDSGLHPTVGALVGQAIAGGTETTLKVALHGGHGFQLGDVLEGAPGGVRRVRAHCDRLGALPWVDNFVRPSVYLTDAQGFVETMGGSGRIGPYPYPTIRIVEQPARGPPRVHTVAASTGSPR